MGTYKIEIQEFLAKTVDIEAQSSYEAVSKAKEMYSKEEVVLDWGDFVEVEFIDTNTQSKSDEKNMLIREIIKYLYEDEKKHFEELGKPNNHIFLALERLERLTI